MTQQCHNCGMDSAGRITLTPDVAALVEHLVETGEYATADEVVRAGVMVLRRRKYEPLVRQWLAEGMTPEIERELPADVIEDVRRDFQQTHEQVMAEVAAGDFVDGEAAMARIRARLDALEAAEQRAKRSA